MNKIFLIAQREFKNRVQKKSFLLATILLPLIFPAIMGILVMISMEQKKNASKELIRYVDEKNFFTPDTSAYDFMKFEGTLEQARLVFDHDQSFALLYIPDIDFFNPNGIKLWTRESLSPSKEGEIKWMIENQIKQKKIQQLNINKETLDNLERGISLETYTTSGDEDKSSNAGLLFGIGFAGGIFMYMFIFIYGAQIMQGIIEEKSSKVVEIIVSSVKPFQLMMGKIIGLASVGLLQFTIWIVLITSLSTILLLVFGVQMPQHQMAAEMSQTNPDKVSEILATLSQIPFGYIIFNFLFYFLGGYLLYGSLFAAVGSAVDSPAEAQQFMFPITIPMIVGYFCLFTFVLQDPHGSISVWLSIIPFTSPIVMMGRAAFDPPLWQLILSMIMLIAGFIFTTWVAGRIYRVGILMHGSKVSYKVLAKWFMMKN